LGFWSTIVDIAPDRAVDGATADARSVSESREQHLVQFYEEESYLFDSVGHWIARGLEQGEACVLLAAPGHRDGVESAVRARRVDLQNAAAQGRYAAVDAEALLSRCRVEPRSAEAGRAGIDEGRFRDEMERLLSSFEERGLRVRVFGEMIALLCAGGEPKEALRLERFWNRLASERSFSILCGYPIDQFAGGDNGELLDDLFTEHRRAVFDGGHAYLSRDDARMRAIVDLQRQARAMAGARPPGASGLELRDRWERLPRTERIKDEFLASLAHELRNPLAPIRNALHLLRDPHHDESVTRYATDLMERQLGHMVRLIDDLIDVSRVTRNRLELHRTVVDLASVIRDAIETVRPTIHSAGQVLGLRLPDREVLLDADPVRLAQVFTNLLDNASKYAERGGRIELAVSTAGSSACVTVADDGIGIPRDMLERVFDMFAHVESASHRARSGLGIGLALAKRLVVLHGGTIEADSEGPGLGSRFTVRLPLLGSRGSTTTSMPNDEEDAEGERRRKVLVVDDSRDAAESLALLLERQGHEVRTAHDGPTALELAAEFLPEVVLLDIGLPGLSGYDVARRIREAPWSEGMALIALTGWGQESDRQRTREAGIAHHLVKPVDPVQLQKLILAP
jgi:signal transduction histidine kinase